MGTINQRSMTGGELAPSLHARVDTAKYQSGLRTCRNFEVMRHGGAQNRPGTELVDEVKDSTDTAHRLIPFVYNAAQAYVLEFGDYYVRIIQDGALLGHGTVAAWADATAYVVGDIKSYSGTDYYCMIAHTSATANDRPSTGTNWTVYWYPLPASVLEVPSPYAMADLALVKFVQSADVMTLTHGSYPVYELRRLGANWWTLGIRSIESSVAIPSGVANNGTATIPSTTITGITTASTPSVFTAVGHGLASGDVADFQFTWFLRYTSLGNTFYSEYVTERFTATITVLTADTFKVTQIGASGFYFAESPYANGSALVYRTLLSGAKYVKVGTTSTLPYKTQYVVTAIDSNLIESTPSIVTGTSDTPAVGTVITVTWTEQTGIQRYNIYKKQGTLFGFIGSSSRGIFTDNGIVPDLTLTAPFPKDLFSAADAYPSVCGYYQQRLLLASSNDQPETVWGSRTGDFANFSKREPLLDDDMVEFNLAGRQVNAVKHVLDLGKLIVFTQAGEFAVLGNAAGALTPSEINAKQYSYHGSADLQPIVIGNTALYVQARGTTIRDLAFDFQVDGYKGNDLTLFAAHLFDKYTVTDWAFQQIPHSIVWVVRSDGTLLGLTYIPDQQIWGWHRHDTDGTILNACVIPEGNEDVLYLLVERDNGKFIERMATRKVEDIKDMLYLDSALSYDGRNSNTGYTVTLTGGTTWDNVDNLTLTFAGTAPLAGTTADIGKEVQITDADGIQYRCAVTVQSSTTVCTVKPNRTIPVALRSVATSDWTLAVKTVTGLAHLEGQAVGVTADGFVVANPYNPAYTGVTVASGSVTLDRAYGVIHVGLSYLCDLETLDIDTVQGETLIDKKKLVNTVSLYVEDSRGLWIGGKPPTDDDTDATEGLYELKIRETENYDDAVDLATGVVDVNIESHWNSNGRVFIRQLDPIPLAVLAVAPAGMIPFRG